ncbi:MAG: hypothetical protein NVV73_15230 [Cellvibrionaceae bacterium]|nr:hypothetical protein [Cellvibrionaceae bacterium]
MQIDPLRPLHTWSIRLCLGLLAVCCWIYPGGAPLAATATKAEPAKVAPALFPLQVNGRTLHYATNFEPVMPGQEVVFSTAAHLVERLAVQVDGKNLSALKDGQFKWRAPQAAGVHKVEAHLRSEAAHTGYQTVTLSLLVMVPTKRISNSHLNGYRIGQYPPAHKNLSSYNAPEGLIEVTVRNQNLRITPQFHLGTVSLQAGGRIPQICGVAAGAAEQAGGISSGSEPEGNCHPQFCGDEWLPHAALQPRNPECCQQLSHLRRCGGYLY